MDTSRRLLYANQESRSTRHTRRINLAVNSVGGRGYNLALDVVKSMPFVISVSSSEVSGVVPYLA